MFGYLISAGLLIAAILLYFRLAEKFRIVDLPNERSSHTGVTIRGGGVIFPVATFIWFLFCGFGLPWLIAGVFLMGMISFIDDLKPLSFLIRLMVHMAAVTLLFLQLQVFALPWPYIFAAYILAIGWINAFNFMDGINGITPFYGLVSLGSFLWVNQSVHFAPDRLIIIVVIAVLIFTWFNARKRARCFAGDVGSITLAFLLSYLMAALILKSGMEVWLLFFSVYGIDTVMTLLYRISRKENIFLPHRSHLYQYLSNELKWPHLQAASLFAGIQLLINVITLIMIQNGWMSRSLFVGILLILTFIYLGIRWRIMHLTNGR